MTKVKISKIGYLIVVALFAVLGVVIYKYPPQDQPTEQNPIKEMSAETYPEITKIEDGIIELSFVLPVIVENDGVITAQDEQMPIYVNVDEYNRCRYDGNSKAECLTFIKQLVLEEIKRHKEMIQMELEEAQKREDRQVYSDEITADDITFTEEELK